MKSVNLSETNSVLGQFVAELRDINIQKDPLRFRRNIERIGEIMAYEISKTLNYYTTQVQTPLGTAPANLCKDQLVIATILRAGLPLHQGFLNYFDKAENAFVSAYRKFIDEENFKIHIEYLASPRIDNKTLLIVDPMLATGRSLDLSYKALMTKGEPSQVHVAAVIATDQALEYLKGFLPEDATVWCAAIDKTLNEHSYIVPGLGDAGDLSYGEKE
jgi:uracil phosphoribosyltransferase